MKAFFKYWMDEVGPECQPVPFYGLSIGSGISDVSIYTLLKAGETIPMTPSYREWKEAGSPVYREPGVRS